MEIMKLRKGLGVSTVGRRVLIVNLSSVTTPTLGIVLHELGGDARTPCGRVGYVKVLRSAACLSLSVAASVAVVVDVSLGWAAKGLELG